MKTTKLHLERTRLITRSCTESARNYLVTCTRKTNNAWMIIHSSPLTRPHPQILLLPSVHQLLPLKFNNQNQSLTPGCDIITTNSIFDIETRQSLDCFARPIKLTDPIELSKLRLSSLSLSRRQLSHVEIGTGVRDPHTYTLLLNFPKFALSIIAHVFYVYVCMRGCM